MVSSTRDPNNSKGCKRDRQCLGITMVTAWIIWLVFLLILTKLFSFRSRILYNEDGYFWRGNPISPDSFVQQRFRKIKNLTNPPRPKYDSQKSLMFCLFTLLLRVKNHIMYWGVWVCWKDSLRKNPAAANVQLWFWLVQSSSPPRQIWVTARFRSVFEIFPWGILGPSTPCTASQWRMKVTQGPLEEIMIAPPRV